LAQLDPASRGAAMTYAGARGLGGAIAGALGVQDPALMRMTQRNQLLQEMDISNPQSLIEVAKKAASIGDNEFAMALVDKARQAQGDVAQIQQRLAAAKASEAQATRERLPVVNPNIQVAAEIASLKDGITQLEEAEQTPENLRTKNILTYKLAELERLSNKDKPDATTNEFKNASVSALTAGPVGSPEYKARFATEFERLTATKEGRPLIKEIGVAANTREPVYTYQEGNNPPQQIIYKTVDGKQTMIPYTGGVDRTTAKTQVTVDAKGEAAFVTELGKLDAKKVNEAFTIRENAVSTINSLNKLAQLPDNELITGQFATGRVGVTNLLATLGLASPTDVNRLSTSQEYQKVAGDVILQTLGGKLGSGFSNADREFIQGLIPQLETNPAARRQLISFMQNKNQEIIKESIRLENYARTNRGLSGFEPKIPMSVAPSQPRPYSGLSDAELKARIKAAQAQQPQ